MRYGSLQEFLSATRAARTGGPVALIFVEDLVEVDSTIRYHRDLGFARLVLFAPDQAATMALAGWEVATEGADLIDTLIDRMQGAPGEIRSGGENFEALRQKGKDHQIEQVGARLREMMPWISAGKAKVEDVSGGD